MNKNTIDREAEREGLALRKQQKEHSMVSERTSQRSEYNKEMFDRLFKGK